MRHRFEREPGFFQGAAAVAAVVLVHLACIPTVFRYSRVIWAHLNVRTMRP